jgi:hypothetical protein
MSSLFETFLTGREPVLGRVRTVTGDDPARAEQAYGAAVGTVLRGIEEKTKTKEGAEDLWSILRKHVEEGNLPAEMPTDEPANQPVEGSGDGPGYGPTQGPTERGGVTVRDLDPQMAEDLLKVIFGDKAPKVQGGIGKVITLDDKATKELLGKVLPAILGGVFGAAERDPEASPQALPRVVGDARREMERRQPTSSKVLETILDKDGDGDVDLADLMGIFGGR